MPLKKHYDFDLSNTGPHKVTLNTWIACAPFEELLCMEIAEVGDGEAVLTMPFIYELAQGAGLMNGGALFSLADTAVMIAIKSRLTPGTRFATISAECKFLAGVTQGVVTAKAKVVKREDRLIYGAATIVNDKGNPVFEFSCYI
jgi:uncharacterized protein (TIGR00369 family)